jgi:hypothetical protein
VSATEGLSQRTLRLRAAFYVCLGGAVVAMLVLLVAIALSNQANGDQVRDCTTPGGECFEQAAKRQAQVIGEPVAPINNVAVVAAACGAAHPGDIAATRACVEEGLNE